MDYIMIGSGPFDEPCAQVGNDDYYDRSKVECNLFIAFIKEICGEPPKGAALIRKGNPHDFGMYYTVDCVFDPEDAEAVEYAYDAESNENLDRWPTWAKIGIDVYKSWKAGNISIRQRNVYIRSLIEDKECAKMIHFKR